MKEFYNLFFLFSVFVCITTQTVNKTLTFRDDHTFTILQLTDMHFGESDILDSYTKVLQVALINNVDPDIIVISGDSVSGYAWNGITPDFYYNCWTNWTLPFLQTQKRYAYTLGNHDDNADLNREQIVNLDMTNPYSLIQSSLGIHGVSNYVLPVFSKFNSSHSSSNLWIFDSNDEGCEYNVFGWGCIYTNQIDWYSQTSKLIEEKYGKSSNNLAFFHIPIPEVKTLWNNGLYYGNSYEEVSCPTVNTGLLSAAEQLTNIEAIFCGHDHLNDYGGFNGGIELVYGRKTGFGGYGPQPGVQRGARVIQLQEYIDESGEIAVNRSHWIINEDLTLETNKTYHTRGDAKYQMICALPSEDNIFEYIAGGITLGTVLLYVIYRLIH